MYVKNKEIEHTIEHKLVKSKYKKKVQILEFQKIMTKKQELEKKQQEMR